MLTIEIDARDMERAALLLERYPERLRAALYRANLNSGAVLLRQIKDNLSGPVLNYKSGNLRRNWSQITPRIAENENAWVGGAGSGETKYAPAHEFGVDRVISGVHVRAYTRAQASRNTYRKSAANYRRGGTGVVAASSGIAFVHPFTRNQHVKIPARPYARRALSEVRERIEAIHSDQIRQAWEKTR